MYVNAKNFGLPINGSPSVLQVGENTNGMGQSLLLMKNNETSNPQLATKKSKINKFRNPINTLLKKNEEKREINKNCQNNINNMNNQNLSNNNNSNQYNNNIPLETNNMDFFNIDTKKELEKAKSNNNNSNLFDLNMGTDKILFPNSNNNSNDGNRNIQSQFSDINTEQFLNNNIQWKNTVNVNNIGNNSPINQNLDEINTKKALEQNKINNGGFINQNMYMVNSIYPQYNMNDNFNSMNGMNYQMMGNFKIYKQ